MKFQEREPFTKINPVLGSYAGAQELVAPSAYGETSVPCALPTSFE